eukprot:Phypoly_transcript_07906.p1 GENE.Phypoly_transcript_07906~~Phypoly_transcript_07906.p1  ORF type:complete len:204 (+),score=11.62 Phypoly_transcript_07906:426-1037(+)
MYATSDPFLPGHFFISVSRATPTWNVYNTEIVEFTFNQQTKTIEQLRSCTYNNSFIYFMIYTNSTMFQLISNGWDNPYTLVQLGLDSCNTWGPGGGNVHPGYASDTAVDAKNNMFCTAWQGIECGSMWYSVPRLKFTPPPFPNSTYEWVIFNSFTMPPNSPTPQLYVTSFVSETFISPRYLGVWQIDVKTGSQWKLVGMKRNI